MKGPVRGRPDRKTREAIVQILDEAMCAGLTFEQSCETFQISSRKVRRWKKEQPHTSKKAWNRLGDDERAAILEAAWSEKMAGLPVSHLYVTGHKTGGYYASLSTIYRVLKEHNLVQPQKRKKRGKGYVTVQELLRQGWSIVCYDGTCFMTDAGIQVWALPVLLLPHRYLLCVGTSIGSFSGEDLRQTVEVAISRLPEDIRNKVMAHSDRGSQMKSKSTKRRMEELLNVPVHFGRPRVKDDHAWIEALNKTMKYHRDRPERFHLVADVRKWVEHFVEIYNNDPHSTLGYVTPSEALRGEAEKILDERKQNLIKAREIRRQAYWSVKLRGQK